MSRLADLALVLRLTDAADAPTAAMLAQYRRDPRRTLPVQEAPIPPVVENEEPEDAPPEQPEAPAPAPQPEARQMRFWRIKRRERLPVVPRDRLPDASLPQCDAGDVLHAPPLTPIQPWSRLWPKLRRLIADEWPGQTPDVDALVDRLSRGEALSRIPRRPVRHWPRHLRVWADVDRRSVPLWADRNRVIDHLSRWCAEVRFGRPEQAARHETILRLGDLPAGAVPHRVAKGRACALVARPTTRRGWRTIPWSARPATATDAPTRAEALLVLLVNLTWVQPGLLRALRCLLPAHAADISTELDVWRHPAVTNAQPDGITLDSAQMQALATRYAALPDALKRDVHETVTRWHAQVPEELQHLESLRAQGTDPSRALFDPARARAFILKAGDAVRGGRRRDLARFAAGVATFLMTQPESDPALRRAIDRLWYAGHQGQAVAVPPQVSPAEEAAVLDADARTDATLALAGTTVGVQPGLPLATVEAGARDWWITRGADRSQVPADAPVELTGCEALTLSTGFERLRLERVKRPYWADCMARDAAGLRAEVTGLGLTLRWRVVDGRGRWAGPAGVGVDQYGVFEDVVIAGISVRFRLIPAGTFMMGSPEHEQGRWKNEGPQRPVTLTVPFWLADVPVTQALWQAVMGDQPSRLKGPERPVERVSWRDAQRFIASAAARAESPSHLGLPTEAQWEYACRAGTTGARYGALDAIAWYAGNSGTESGRKGTHPVRQKAPNAWGLYDMLGNVWEWCADCHGPYPAEAATDPVGPAEGAYRVVRGGSWFFGARYVRAAYRHWAHPGYRDGLLGVRLSRGPAPSARSAEPRAEPASTRRSDPPARSDGAGGQARSAGGGASPEGRRPSEAQQAKIAKFSTEESP